MAQPFPYTYICCPCTDPSVPLSKSSTVDNRSSRDFASPTTVGSESLVSASEEERTFDPRSPRANYCLYPLQHLLYCEDCHTIRCPKCTIDEIVCWYCPSCLFEVPSSIIKSDGTRCTRNCFNCPICTSPMSVNGLGREKVGELPRGPWILSCPYCLWTTLDIGIKFDKPTNIYSQLSKMSNGGLKKEEHSHHKEVSSRERPPEKIIEEGEDAPPPPPPKDDEPGLEIMDSDDRFKRLRSFYKDQLSGLSSNTGFFEGREIPFSSPSSMARIMSIYTSLGGAMKKTKTKPLSMREAVTPEEGFVVHSPDAEIATIEKLRSLGHLEHLSSHEQRFSQRYPENCRFNSSLRPIPTLLRTKRSKRCRECRHILVKPEYKVRSTRFRIKLVAFSYIPQITIKPLYVGRTNLNSLPPGLPTQLVMIFKNPLFVPVQLHLATPAITPGPRQNKVTILCPEFEIGANTDVWDEALKASESKRSSRVGTAEGDRSAEAGKVWDKGRNWTAIVVEIVPGFKSEQNAGMEILDEQDLDDDVVEIPVFVRMEYSPESVGDEPIPGESGSAGEEKEKEKRELAYWCVLGAGRISRLGGK